MYTDFQKNILMNNEAIEKFYELFEQPSYMYLFCYTLLAAMVSFKTHNVKSY